MNYMLLIYEDERVSGGQRQGVAFDECIDLCEGLVERLKANGQYISAGVLQPTPTAKSLRVRDGQSLVTDGPFAEAREQLAGYLMIRVESMDEALAIGAEHPVAKYGTVEVRPVFGIPYLDEDDPKSPMLIGIK
ncbi:YciI family protein [bacterium]|nr:MAG: YciI family protein [bacterium]